MSNPSLCDYRSSGFWQASWTKWFRLFSFQKNLKTLWVLFTKSNNISWRCVVGFLFIVLFIYFVHQNGFKTRTKAYQVFRVFSHTKPLTFVERSSCNVMKLNFSVLADWTKTTQDTRNVRWRRAGRLPPFLGSSVHFAPADGTKFHHEHKKQLHQRRRSLSSNAEQHLPSPHIHQSGGSWCEASSMTRILKMPSFPVELFPLSILSKNYRFLEKISSILLAIWPGRYRDNFVLNDIMMGKLQRSVLPSSKW